jgi:class 3 adenylate cyclase/tetratricopeptide (TPR) repeat protein
LDCSSCGHENRDSARFCEACGARLVLACSGCGNELRAGARFCDACGAPTRTAPVAPKPHAPQPAAPERAPERAPRDYTPKHLADKILQSKSALEGERKQVSVLFADVRGSMELAEQVDAEEWHSILDRFFSILADGVHRFEGTINQYTGDGIMALFGAPIAHEDHAHRACYAALQLAESLAAYAREVKRDRGLNFSVRMGINSGDVVVGKIGDDLRMDYTAQGQTVGLAARMQDLASPDTTYVTGSTRSLVDGYFDLADLGAFQVKGVRDPVPVYQLNGVGSLRTRLDVSRARGLTRFVGRADDLQTLESAVEGCLQGGGGVIGLVAEAGVGKSRLCYEFLERCRARGLRTLEGQAVAHGKNIPFLPILQVFRAYFGITDQDDDRAAREKIAGRLLLLDDSFKDALPLLFEFMGVPDPERPAPRQDPRARQRGLFGVMRKLLNSARSEAPIVTLIEDLHWLDAGSESWLAEMVDAIGGTPGLLVVNYRPEYHADWMQKSYYRQMPLAPLGPEAIRELLEDLLGRDESVAGLAERIHERTAGNPFFTEEVIQSLIEAGNLQGARGRYRLVTPVAELSIPGTVQSILAARIDRLIERAKQVLHTAAVIGKEFAEPILEEVAELPRAELAQALETLKGGEFIYEQSLYPVAEYAFKHPLTQEVALHSQLKERRRRVHGHVAKAIEASSADRLDGQAALLAHHWQEAGEALKAAHWHRRAAASAGASHAPEMIRHFESARALLRDGPETGESLELRIGTLGSLLTQSVRFGLPAETSERYLAEGEELLAKTDDPRVRIPFLQGHGTFLAYTGQPQRGAELLREAIRSSDALDDAQLQVGSRLILQIPFVAIGPAPEAAEIAREALDLLPAGAPLETHVLGYDTESALRSFRGWYLAWSGRMEEALRECERARNRARATDDTVALALALALSTAVVAAAGDPDQAVSHGRRALELSESEGIPNLILISAGTLGRALVLAGQFQQAFDVTRMGLETSERMPILRTQLGSPHAEALLELGRGEEALAAARSAVAFTAQMKADLIATDDQLALARVLCRTQGVAARDEIETALARADELAERTGYVASRPRLHVERGRLAHALGDTETHRRELEEAVRRFRGLGAVAFAERVELGSSGA